MIGYKVTVDDSVQSILNKESAYKSFEDSKFVQEHRRYGDRKVVTIDTVVIADSKEGGEKLHKDIMSTKQSWMVTGTHQKGYEYELAVPTREKAREIKRLHISKGFGCIKIVRRTYQVLKEEVVR